MARKDETGICSEVWDYLAAPLPEVEVHVMTPEEVDQQVALFEAMLDLMYGATVH